MTSFPARRLPAPRRNCRNRRSRPLQRHWLIHSLFPAAILLAAGCEENKTTKNTIVVASGEGLQMMIDSVRIGGDRKPVVDFTLSDAEGKPLEIADLDGPPSFVLGWIETDPSTGLTRYQSHILRTVAGAPYTYNGQSLDPTLASATQVGTDQGGTFQTSKPGVHRYTFGTALPQGYDRTRTHTVAAYVTRDDDAHVANVVYSFVPAGGAPTVMREVASTDACNACHDPLEAHGGSRREVGLCIICHNDQTIDPETGNTVEFAVMIHKIHTGENLTQQPYYIIGFRQSVNDYSTVAFPQDLRNCTTCHKDGTEADNWRTKPARAPCGACHDAVDFSTGEGHSDSLQQLDDTLCSRCHRDVAVEEFDNTVPGAHTIPAKSSVNPQLTFAITDVQGMTPGNQPSVRFTITDKSGPVDIATLNRVGIIFAGPSADYSQLLGDGHSFTIQGSNATAGLTTNATGDYTYAPAGYEIPADATDTWSVGLEGRTGDLPAGEGTERFSGTNPIAHVDVTDGTLGGGSPEPRRMVVSDESCNVCHDDLVFHGDQRTDVQFCLLCHNRLATDEEQRPGLDPTTNPPETIDFKVLIHRIHRGDDLENPYTVYGFNSSVHDFTGVSFPGDVRNCARCHAEDTQLLPLPAGLGATVINIAGVPVPGDDAALPPTSAACTGCHDDDATLTHVRLNTIFVDPSNFEEACGVCHGEGSTEAVSAVHAQE
jgi:OmcA/MtrC family decaheme c-type cytochrome